MNNLKQYFEEWKDGEYKKLSRREIGDEETKPKRTYIHFDRKISVHEKGSKFSFDKYQQIFINPAKLRTQIAFWPFLKLELEEIRIKNQKEGKLRKKEIKKRSVYFAAHRDALVYSWYSFILNKLYDPILFKLGIEDNITAYRKIPQDEDNSKNKCNIHFAKEVFDFIKSKEEDCVAFVADITKFFDNLDHKHLEKEWKNVLGLAENQPLPDDHQLIYNNLTHFKYVDAEKVYDVFGIKFKTKKIKINGKSKTIRIPKIGNKVIKNILDEPLSRKDFVSRVVRNNLIKGNENWNKDKKCLKGIMQGSPISATLANIYMLSFDKKISDLLKSKNGIYKRYSDDIVVVCNKEDYELIKYTILTEIKNYHLDINITKTDTTYFSKNNTGLCGYECNCGKGNLKKMQYLGFEFDGNKIFIRPKSLTSYYRKMKSKVRKAVSIAFGKKSKTKNKNNIVFKKSLNEKYIKKGKRSFISYALRANEIMGDGTIKKQLRKRSKIMKNYLEDHIKKKKEKQMGKSKKARFNQNFKERVQQNRKHSKPILNSNLSYQHNTSVPLRTSDQKQSSPA